MGNQTVQPPQTLRLPAAGSNPEFDRFAELSRKLFAVPKSAITADAPNLKRDGTPKQKPGRKPKEQKPAL